MGIKTSTGTIMRFFSITPQTLELSWTGNTASSVTANFNTNVSTSADFVLCDIFITANISDHQNIMMGRSGQIGNNKNWVDTRGSQPSGQFQNMGANLILLTYHGEADGFSANYGIWYSSQMLPTNGRTFYYNNYGNSGSNGYIFIKYRGYYEEEGN